MGAGEQLGIEIAQLGDIYLPLIGWTIAGLFVLRYFPASLPRLLGRALYWVGVPLQILSFVLRADLGRSVWIVPEIVCLALLLGLALAWAIYRSDEPHVRGGYLLASTLGNTGFVGLAIAPSLIDRAYLSWAVLFAITHNIAGSYGIGSAIASVYGRKVAGTQWWHHLQSLLGTPSIWAFGLGVALKLSNIALPAPLAAGLHGSVRVVVPVALMLVGIRFREIRTWTGIGRALPAVAIKLLLVPFIVGVAMTVAGIAGMPRLGTVLQAGMPAAFASAILAEEYDLDREGIVASIALSSVGVLATIPLWLWLFPA